MNVTVYSKPDCVQCNYTYKKMDQLGIPYNTVDVTQDRDALAFVVGLGYQQVPVVIAGGQTWSGYSPDKIASLAL